MFVPEITLENPEDLLKIPAKVKLVSLEPGYEWWYLRLQVFDGVCVYTNIQPKGRYVNGTLQFFVGDSMIPTPRDKTSTESLEDYDYYKPENLKQYLELEMKKLKAEGWLEGKFTSCVLIAQEEK